MRKPPKKKSVTDSRYLLVYSDEPEKRFEELGKLVAKKEIRWSHFTVEGKRGCHYYLKLKRKK